MTADQGQGAAGANATATLEEVSCVYEPPSFDDLKWPPELAYTYAQLYKKLTRRYSHEEAWGRLWRFLLYIVAPILVLGISLAASPQERWYALWNAVVGFLLAALVLFIIFIAWLMNQDAAATAAELAARLIVATRSPRARRQGLNALDLRRLSQAATHVQQAADWRGSVVATVIIALVLTAFTAAVRQVTPEFVAGIIAADNMMASSLPGFLARVTYLAVPAYVGFSVFGYFRRFTSQEHANRVILLATADALAALEDCGLDFVRSLGFREKRIVIKRLGYQLSPRVLSYSWKNEFFSPDYAQKQGSANCWHLEPLAPKEEPYWSDLPLMLLSVAPAVFIAYDNWIYGGFLRAQAHLRQGTSGGSGAKAQRPSRRKRDNRKQ